jgi:hypothetical protein
MAHFSIEHNIQTFNDSFNQDISHYDFPLYIYEIRFGNAFNQDIGLVRWPPNLVILDFGDQFDQNINQLCHVSSLEVLFLRGQFNRDISSMYTSNLHTLFMGEVFDQVITLLPKSFVKLHLGFSFNQDVTSVTWPQSLSEIFLSELFNKPIDILWPRSLNEITFARRFNQNIKNVVFHELSMVHDYSQKITINSCNFPKSLRKILHYASFNADAIINYERPFGQYTKMTRHL